jgi:hypothetical protein
MGQAALMQPDEPDDLPLQGSRCLGGKVEKPIPYDLAELDTYSDNKHGATNHSGGADILWSPGIFSWVSANLFCKERETVCSINPGGEKLTLRMKMENTKRLTYTLL